MAYICYFDAFSEPWVIRNFTESPDRPSALWPIIVAIGAVEI
jgi:hypothetical protein